MSWSTSTSKPVLKIAAEVELEKLFTQAINSGGVQTQGVTQAEVVRNLGSVADQIRVAKAAAVELLKVIPGPYVSISLSGHANGVGWHKKDGYANDCISVSVSQWVEGS